MTRTCFIHIGLPKTGSTSIQATLKNAVSDKVAYSSFAGVVHNNALLTMFSGKIHIHQTLQYADKGALEKLREESWRAFQNDMQGNKNLVISSEVISRLLTREEQEHLKKLLLEHFDDIQCLAYLRPVIPFAASGFQQMVKQGRTKFEPDLIWFRERLETWMSVFGAQNVTLRYFDPKTLKNGDVVEDAMDFFGYQLDPQWYSRRNDTLSLEAMALVYKFNTLQDPTLPLTTKQAARWEMIKKLRDFGTGKFGFSQAILDQCVQDQRADIDWAEQLTGFDLVGHAPKGVQEIGSQEELLQLAEDCMPKVKAEFGVERLDQLTHSWQSTLQAALPTGVKRRAFAWLSKIKRRFG